MLSKKIYKLKLSERAILIIALLSIAIIFTGVLLIAVYENSFHKKTVLNNSLCIAQSVSNQYLTCLELDVPETQIGDYLSKNSVNNSEVIVVFDSSGEAIFPNDFNISILEIQKKLEPKGYLFTGNSFQLYYPIYRNSNFMGAVYLEQIHTNWLFRSKMLYVFCFLLFVLLGAIFAFYLRSRSLSGAIRKLNLHLKSNLNTDFPKEFDDLKLNNQLKDLIKNFNLFIKVFKRRNQEVKAVVEELRTSELEYQKLYENAPDMYFSVAIESKLIIRCNNTLCNFTGYTKNEILSKSVFSLFSEESLEEAEIFFSGICLINNYKPEFVIKNKNGKCINVITDKTVVNDEDGNVLYINVVMRDLSHLEETERERQNAIDKLHQLLKQADLSRRALLSVVEDQKNAKLELSNLNQSLEKVIAERTEKLQIANNELEAFSYSISHDLRAPLRHINGFINLFLENVSFKLTKQESEYIQVVVNSANEMGELIDSLLSFAKISRTGIKFTDIDMNNQLKQVLDFFEADIVRRKIQITASNLPNVNGDTKLIKQVWVNLISNAIKYTGKTENPIIEIGSKIEDAEIVFFVKDNGEGFNMKYIDKLFGVFQRLHKTHDFEGIGIGLANVNSIIIKHGGKCWAIGEPGKGATFYFSLPK